MSNYPKLNIEPVLAPSKDYKKLILKVNIFLNAKERISKFFYRFDDNDFKRLNEKLSLAVNDYQKELVINTEIFVEFRDLGMLFVFKNYSLRFVKKQKEETYYFDLSYIENQSYY